MELDDVEMDLDFESDPIKEFLQRKLEEIQHRNKKLEKEIIEKKELLERCLNMNSAIEGKDMEVTEVWKKIWNNKCIFGLHLKNSSAVGSVAIKKILLNWNSSTFITYKIKIFDLKDSKTQKHLQSLPKESNIISTESIVLLVVDKPDFLKQILYNITGIILHSTDSTATQDKQISIPDLEIQVKDFNEPLLEIKNSDLLNKELRSILTCLSANEEYFLVGKIGNNSMEAVLPREAGYEEIKFESERMFLVNGISTCVTGCLIQILNESEDNFSMKILCLNQETALQILHHMYSCISDLCIVPKSHEIYLSQSTSSQVMNDVDEAKKNKFAEALSKQIGFIDGFYKNGVKECSRENYLKFRMELNRLQLETDVLYTKCCNNAS